MCARVFRGFGEEEKPGRREAVALSGISDADF